MLISTEMRSYTTKILICGQKYYLDEFTGFYFFTMFHWFKKTTIHRIKKLKKSVFGGRYRKKMKIIIRLYTVSHNTN